MQLLLTAATLAAVVGLGSTTCTNSAPGIEVRTTNGVTEQRYVFTGECSTGDTLTLTGPNGEELTAGPFEMSVHLQNCVSRDCGRYLRQEITEYGWEDSTSRTACTPVPPAHIRPSSDCEDWYGRLICKPSVRIWEQEPGILKWAWSATTDEGDCQDGIGLGSGWRPFVYRDATYYFTSEEKRQCSSYELSISNVPDWMTTTSATMIPQTSSFAVVGQAAYAGDLGNSCPGTRTDVMTSFTPGSKGNLIYYDSCKGRSVAMQWSDRNGYSCAPQFKIHPHAPKDAPDWILENDLTFKTKGTFSYGVKTEFTPAFREECREKARIDCLKRCGSWSCAVKTHGYSPSDSMQCLPAGSAFSLDGAGGKMIEALETSTTPSSSKILSDLGIVAQVISTKCTNSEIQESVPLLDKEPEQYKEKTALESALDDVLYYGIIAVAVFVALICVCCCAPMIRDLTRSVKRE